MRLLPVILLLGALVALLPACAATPPALGLPDGSRLIPLAALAKFQVTRSGGAIVTLTRGAQSIRLIIDTSYYDEPGGNEVKQPNYPTIIHGGELYVADNVLETLGITVSVAKGALQLAAQVKGAPQTAPWPLQVLPLDGSGTGCYPIVDFRNGCLLGGLWNGRWHPSDTIMRKMTGKETYRLYALNKALGTTAGGKPESRAVEGDYGDYIRTAVTKEALGIACNWNAMPRPVRMQNTQQALYQQEVRRIVEAHGIKAGTVVIHQLLRVDMDGDRQEEVVINASSSGEVDETVSFRLMAVRKIIDGKVRTLVPFAGFRTELYDDGGVSIPGRLEIAGVLDVDGDGRQELLIRTQTGCSETTFVYKYHTGTFWRVLTGGWSD